MKIRSFEPIILFLSSLLFSGIALGEDEGPGTVSTGTEAIRNNAVAPVYPERALSQGVEGWVLASYVVNADGTTSDIIILDSSVGGYFEQAVVEAVERFEYTPATFNGRPAAQAKNTNLFTFWIKDGGKLSRRYRRAYEQTMEDIENRDYESALERIEDLDEREARVFGDQFILDLLKGEYWRDQADYPKALHHYRRALLVLDNLGWKEFQTDTFRIVIMLSAHLKNFGLAFETYDKLMALQPDLAPDDPVVILISRTRALVDSNSPFAVSGIINQPCDYCETVVPSWHYVLMRNEFTIREVEGELTDLKLLCGYHYVSMPYQPETKWRVNQDWGACQLYVIGTEGTKFQLIEL